MSEQPTATNAGGAHAADTESLFALAGHSATVQALRSRRVQELEDLREAALAAVVTNYDDLGPEQSTAFSRMLNALAPILAQRPVDGPVDVEALRAVAMLVHGALQGAGSSETTSGRVTLVRTPAQPALPRGGGNNPASLEDAILRINPDAQPASVSAIVNMVPRLGPNDLAFIQGSRGFATRPADNNGDPIFDNQPRRPRIDNTDQRQEQQPAHADPDNTGAGELPLQSTWPPLDTTLPPVSGPPNQATGGTIYGGTANTTPNDQEPPLGFDRGARPGRRTGYQG